MKPGLFTLPGQGWVSGATFTSKDKRVVLKISGHPDSSGIYVGIAKASQVSRLEYRVFCEEKSLFAEPSPLTVTPIACLGQMTPEIEFRVAGRLIRRTGLKSSVEGKLSITFDSAGSLPRVFVPMKDLSVEGQYKNFAAVNGGEYLEVHPVQQGLPFRHLSRSIVFNPGVGSEVRTTIDLLNPVTGVWDIYPLKCE